MKSFSTAELTNQSHAFPKVNVILEKKKKSILKTTFQTHAHMN